LFWGFRGTVARGKVVRGNVKGYQVMIPWPLFPQMTSV
jgi:hypothetical protein